MAKGQEKRATSDAAVAESAPEPKSASRKGKAPADPAKLANKLRNAKRALRRARAGQTPAATEPIASTSTGRRTIPASALQWTSLDATFDLDAEGGAFGLEECEDVDVVYGEPDADGHRSVQFAVKGDRVGAGDAANEEEEEEWVPVAEQADDSQASVDEDDADAVARDYAAVVAESSTRLAKLDDSPFDDSLLAEYAALRKSLRTPLKHALHRLGFVKPTAIQSQAWPLTLGGKRDVVGVAETGSGKTLAYGLPILQHVLDTLGSNAGLAAMILAPTRELAMQVRQHLIAVVRAACDIDDADERPLPVRIVAVTGGLSVHKQRRLLASGADILVATPGRLWDLASNDRTFADSLRTVRFLVLDEADRMVEAGHFAELDNLLGLVRRPSTDDSAFKNDFDADEAGGPMPATPLAEMQTFVFSATLDKKLQVNLKRRRGKQARSAAQADTLGDLLETLDFRDEDPAVIDLTPEKGVAAGLRECMIECLTKEKDLYLYHFLLRYPARTLVFLSAIDGIRRLLPLLTLLELDVVAIHSGMQQRARLKSLDRFRKSSTCIMLATDVAARGLDVAGVEHVVHFQLPRTADAYVHRSGRTARAGQAGLGLILLAPEEKSAQRALFKQLGRSDDLEELPIEYSILEKLQKRLDVAKKIENAEHKSAKAHNEEKWLRNAAESMELDVGQTNDSDDDLPSSRDRKRAHGRVFQLKDELRTMLKQPLLARGISARYITSSIGDKAGFVDTLVNNSHHSTLLGVAKRPALADAGRPSAKRRKAAPTPAVE